MGRRPGELPIKEQLRLKRLQWFKHLQRMPDHQPQKHCYVQTDRKEEEARRDLFVVGGWCHQKKPN